MARGHYAMRSGQQSRPPAGAPLRARLSWAFFDWANQPFFTVITTFIFVPYFTDVLVGDSVRGQALWGYILFAAGVIIAGLSPFLGSIADAGGPRKPWIFFFQAMTVIGCVLLFWGYPNRPDLLPLVIAGLLLGTIGAEFAIVFNNAQLPHLVPPERMGRLSGLGWGMGYLGGLVALFIVLFITRPATFGIAVPEGQLLFGLDEAAHDVDRWIGPASALWLIVFVIPMFLFVPDAPASGLSKIEAAKRGILSLFNTFRAIKHYRNPLLFLIAYMIYNDGLAAIIAFGGVYARGTFGWESASLGAFGILLTVIATIGAFVGGWLDDKFGSKPVILIAIIAVTIASLGIVSVGSNSVLFLFEVAPPQKGGGLFASAPEQVFLAFALLLGVGMGPMQAASRTMIGRLAPKHMVGEFYGLFALSGRATTALAPLAIALVTDFTNSQRLGVVVVVVFLIIGFALLLKVREEPSAASEH